MRHLTAYTPEEELSGQSTFVTDKSKDGLPTDSDREKETTLPPGSATPNTPQKEDGAGGNGRDLKAPAYNAPDGDSDVSERPRTLPTPGEMYGTPSKDDYNHLTRRTMEAYKPRTPWKRQQQQDPWDRLDDQKYYRLNKSRIIERVNRWYDKVKRNVRFKNLREDRREDPERHERRASPDIEADADVLAEEREAYTPWSLGKKRRRLRGPARTERRRQYRRDRAQSRAQHRRWYQKNKNKPAFKRRQKLRRKNPNRFRLRPAAFAPTADIWFVFGPQMATGHVDSVSKDAVTFSREPDDGDVYSLTPRAFLHSVVFLTPEDADAMFEVLDREVGGEAYDEPDEADILSQARLYGVDSETLMEAAVFVLGKPLVDADPEEREDFSTALVEAAMEEWEEFGPDDGSVAARVASRFLGAGAIMLYDQRPPDEGSWEKPDLEGRPFASPGPGQVTNTNPNPTHAPSSGGMPEVDTTGFPGGSGKVIPESMKTAATLDDITGRTSPDVARRARGVKVRLSRADPDRGIWTFRAAGSEGKSYTIRVKAERRGNVRDVLKAQVKVSCDCDFFRYQGPEHWGRVEGYLYGKPRGTAAAPSEKDLKGQHWACKHVLAAIALARNYRFSAEIAFPVDFELVPVFGPDPVRVATRYGGDQGG